MSDNLQRLILIRHAHALAAVLGQDDFDRTLSSQGKDDAYKAGVWLQQQGFDADLALISPACRTRQTFAGLREGGWVLSETRFEPRLYEASLGMLLAAIEDTTQANPSARSMTVIAHNPGLEYLLIHLTDADGFRWQGMPTAAVAILELNKTQSFLAAGSAVLARFRAP